jgi:hypothetical protein
VTDTVNGCSETATYNYISNGFTSVNAIQSIRVYPNPFTGNQFNIEIGAVTSSRVTIELYDALGSVVHSSTAETGTGDSEFTVTIPFVKAGIYLLKIRNKDGMTVKRIVCKGN